MKDLREYIFDNRIRQTQIASAVQISSGYMSELVAGKKRPSPRLAAKIEAITGIPLRTLLGLDERGRDD